jgi:esterase
MDDEELAAQYDEFGMFKIYADYEGIPWHGQPAVERRAVNVGSGQNVSALVWGSDDPELVLLHGGGQNAHTWDSVALAFGVSLVAIDLPGHGHSDRREDRDYNAPANAKAVAAAIDELAPRAEAVVGMSLGGLTCIALAAERPDLVSRAVIVDVTPGVLARTAGMTSAQRGTTALVGGPQSYPSFDAMLRAAAAAAPGRPIETLRPGVLHNSRRREDGNWEWRYDVGRGGVAPHHYTSLWDDVSAIRAPVMLVRGGSSMFVHDDDVTEFLNRQPATRVEVVEGAGHSVQSDRPLVLANLITDFLGSTESAARG